MKIVLLKNIAGLGDRGEIKDVKRGYALNYLLPNNLAAIPGTVVIKKVDKKKDELYKKQNIEKLKNKLKDLTVNFSCETNDKGTLYASIDKLAIENELKKKGIDIRVHNLNPSHLKTVGTHDVELIANEGIKTKITIIINSN